MDKSLSPTRDKKGRWLKGYAPNPTGKKGNYDEALVKYGLEKIGKDGKLLVDFLLNIMNGKDTVSEGIKPRRITVTQSIRATEILFNRVFGGVKASIQLDANINISEIFMASMNIIEERRATNVISNSNGNEILFRKY